MPRRIIYHGHNISTLLICKKNVIAFQSFCIVIRRGLEANGTFVWG